MPLYFVLRQLHRACRHHQSPNLLDDGLAIVSQVLRLLRDPRPRSRSARILVVFGVKEEYLM